MCFLVGKLMEKCFRFLVIFKNLQFNMKVSGGKINWKIFVNFEGPDLRVSVKVSNTFLTGKTQLKTGRKISFFLYWKNVLISKKSQSFLDTWINYAKNSNFSSQIKWGKLEKTFTFIHLCLIRMRCKLPCNKW